MPAGNYNFTVEQGATLIQDFYWREENGTTPINVTGYTARMQGRTTVESNTTLFDWSTATGHFFTSGASGRFTLTVSDTETSALDFDTAPGRTRGTCQYDLEIESPTGVVTRLLEGTITLSPEVTR